MTPSSTDCIQKEITLRATRARVWRAISDSSEFGEWFKVRLDGEFRVGETIRGQITHPGCEHMVFEARVETMEPEQRFAFRWWPQAVDPEFDTSGQPSTLVEFVLEESGRGTRLTVTESGFDALPEDRRAEFLHRNEGGWTAQMENIKNHVDA